ncbi:unnamed protein product [Calypogeia fissa]
MNTPGSTRLCLLPTFGVLVRLVSPLREPTDSPSSSSDCSPGASHYSRHGASGLTSPSAVAAVCSRDFHEVLRDVGLNVAILIPLWPRSLDCSGGPAWGGSSQTPVDRAHTASFGWTLAEGLSSDLVGGPSRALGSWTSSSFPRGPTCPDHHNHNNTRPCS